jgi:hypothetical protein
LEQSTGVNMFEDLLDYVTSPRIALQQPISGWLDLGDSEMPSSYLSIQGKFNSDLSLDFNSIPEGELRYASFQGIESLDGYDGLKNDRPQVSVNEIPNSAMELPVTPSLTGCSEDESVSSDRSPGSSHSYLFKATESSNASVKHRKPNKPCMSKNAINARKRRPQKKELEQKLQVENRRYQKEIKALQKEVNHLKQQSEFQKKKIIYLESVIANSKSLGHLIGYRSDDSISLNGTKYFTQAPTFNEVSKYQLNMAESRQPLSLVESSRESPRESPRESQRIATTPYSSTSALPGICVHLMNEFASVELCPQCNEQSILAYESAKGRTSVSRLSSTKRDHDNKILPY